MGDTIEELEELEDQAKAEKLVKDWLRARIVEIKATSH